MKANMLDYLEETAQRVPDRMAFFDDRESLTFAGLRETARRIGSRLIPCVPPRTPVALPQRITSDPELLELVSSYVERKQLYVITQFNHPAEITAESTAAVRALLRAGIPVCNQTVLLRGVNDHAKILVELMNSLVGIGVMPYYVFQCRPVTGVKNRFQVPLREGSQIVAEAQANLNGLAKSFRFMMSHETGKIEILGCLHDVASKGMEANMLFRYHQARDRSNLGKLFTMELPTDACWL